MSFKETFDQLMAVIFKTFRSFSSLWNWRVQFHYKVVIVCLLGDAEVMGLRTETMWRQQALGESHCSVHMLNNAFFYLSLSFLLCFPFCSSVQFDFECRAHGANFLAYPPVVAGGNRANTLHYINNNQIVKVKYQTRSWSPLGLFILRGGVRSHWLKVSLFVTW